MKKLKDEDFICLEPRLFPGPSDVDIVETAGFVDLETRFKRLEQSGYTAQFYRDMYDTEDYRQIFLGDETEIFADDDEDTVQKKLILQEQYRQNIIKKKLGDLDGANDDSEAPQAGGSSEVKSSSQRSSEKE